MNWQSKKQDALKANSFKLNLRRVKIFEILKNTSP
jgi:hypothetical protein